MIFSAAQQEETGTIETPANDDAPRSASAWFLALREVPGDAELRARFEAWLTANPAHLVEWDEVKRTYEAMGRIQPVFAHRWGGFAASRKALRTDARRVGRASWMMGAAASVAAVCLLGALAPDLVLELKADEQTGPAQRQIVRLEDGSTVRLGPRSAIGIAFDGQGRRVRLLKGEAFFEVVHDAARPFTVEANDLRVTDIGTAFDVRLGAAGEGVAVRQGVVEVDGGEGGTGLSKRLNAGDWITVVSDGRVEQGHSPPAEIAPWTGGRLIAKNRTVANIVDDLRPYFDGVILLRGDALARTPLTGVYNLDDPVAALRAVAQAQGATVRRISPWLIVISGS